MTGKSRVVTFRMDQATWDFMRQLVPYTRYKKASSFIREGIALLLRQEDEQPSGWTVGRPRRGVTDPAPGRAVVDVRATFAGRRWPWASPSAPLAPVRSTGRPARGVIPTTRRELAVWVLAGPRPSPTDADRRRRQRAAGPRADPPRH